MYLLANLCTVQPLSDCSHRRLVTTDTLKEEKSRNRAVQGTVSVFHPNHKGGPGGEVPGCHASGSYLHILISPLRLSTRLRMETR